jgi:Flp pilus assembly protein TadB
MPVFVYFIIGALIFGAFLMFSISQVKKLGKFLKIYEDVAETENDDYKRLSKIKRREPEKAEKPKHSRKVMILSLVKYLLILVLFTFITSFGSYMVFLMIFAWAFILYFTFYYIKLWKYHNYPVLLLIFAVLFTIAGSTALSPLIKSGIMTFLNKI